ncbi:Ankyrin2 [Gryllus bimaculatus]|nr:Ankyrin2 [Gryllus bimaculatus]
MIPSLAKFREAARRSAGAPWWSACCGTAARPAGRRLPHERAEGGGERGVVPAFAAAAPDLLRGDNAACALLCAAREGRERRLAVMLSMGLDPNAQAAWAHMPPLHAALRARARGHGADANTQVLTLLAGVRKLGNGRRCRAGTEATPSGERVLERNCEVAKLRSGTHNGADINASDVFGRTPLHWAADKGAAACVKALIERGADPNVRDPRRMTPLIMAAQASTDMLLPFPYLDMDPDPTPLHRAVEACRSGRKCQGQQRLDACPHQRQIGSDRDDDTAVRGRLRHHHGDRRRRDAAAPGRRQQQPEHGRVPSTRAPDGKDASWYSTCLGSCLNRVADIFLRDTGAGQRCTAATGRHGAASSPPAAGLATTGACPVRPAPVTTTATHLLRHARCRAARRYTRRRRAGTNEEVTSCCWRAADRLVARRRGPRAADVAVDMPLQRLIAAGIAA